MKELLEEETNVKCDNCGANLDLSKNTKCNYCGSQKEVKQDVKNEFFVYTYACSSCEKQIVLDYGVIPGQCFFCDSVINKTAIKMQPVTDLLSLEISKADMLANLKAWATKGLGTSGLWRYKLLNDDSSKITTTYLPINIEYNPDLKLNIYEFAPIDSKVESFLPRNKRAIGREVSKANGGKGTKLIPVYLGKVPYGKKRYYYIVNGVTGEIQGEKAISKVQLFIMRFMLGIVIAGFTIIIISIVIAIFSSHK